MSSKFFTGNGFLTEEGERLLMDVRDSIINVMDQDDVHDMSESELRVLGANLQRMAGEAISKMLSRRLQLDAEMRALTDEEFYAHLLQKYGENWILHTLEPAELNRIPMADLAKLATEIRDVGENMRQYMISNGLRQK